MSTKFDMEFTSGDHWPANFECVDSADDAIDISAATIQFRMSTVAGVTVMTRTVSDGITITSGTDGLCSLLVTPTHQTSASVSGSTRYVYQFRVTTAAGRVLTQAHGNISVLPSLF